MKTFGIAFVLCIASGASLAQSSAQAPTQDGAITVRRESTLTGERARTQAPIILVDGSKRTATGWAAPTTGTVAVKSVSDPSKTSTAKLNPKGAAVSFAEDTAVQPPAIVRTGAVARWVDQSKPCPAYYTGTITWQAEEVSTVTSGWTATGNIRNYSEASCVAIVETRWVASGASCPAGYTGSHTWEAEQRRSGGGPWYDTGARRYESYTCTAPPPPVDMTKVIASCQFNGNTGFGTSQASQLRSGSCSQAGEFTSVPSSTLAIAAVFAVGDYNVTGTSTVIPQFADPSKWAVSWSGDCTGTGPTCMTNHDRVSWQGDDATFSATATVTYLPTGAQVTRNVFASFMVCGVRNRYECP